jgi:hypothetical protein
MMLSFMTREGPGKLLIKFVIIIVKIRRDQVKLGIRDSFRESQILSFNIKDKVKIIFVDVSPRVVEKKFLSFDDCFVSCVRRNAKRKFKKQIIVRSKIACFQ